MHCRLLAPTASGRIALLLSLILVLPSLTGVAQDQKKKGKRKPSPESLGGVYRRWLDNDVAPIITEAERKAFLALKTDEERGQFIEEFWRLRDPDPDTYANEYREEYYQRIAYANEHFTSGIPGWKTDRGRIYLRFGPPDQKESHPSGGSYDRPSWEGGGTTSTYPFEIWWYRHLEGVGSDVEIEFVDPTGSGEYRIARSPDEKDALLYVPNAGLTLAEMLGLDSKANRIAFGNRGQVFQRVKDNPFERLDLERKLQQPPPVKFNRPGWITAESDYPKITYDRLPFSLRVDFLRVTENAVTTSFTVQLENQDLVYKDVGGIQQAKANIYARITSVSGRRVDAFEDVVTSSYLPEALASGLEARSVYQRKVVLAPGSYKIDLFVRDTSSGRMDAIHQGFTVPRYAEEELSASTLVLASRLEPLDGRAATGPFIYGSVKVIPNVTGIFKPEQRLGLYLQVYHVALDQTTLRPDLDVEYVIAQKGREVRRLKEDGRDGLSKLNHQQVTLARLIPLKGLMPGDYEVAVHIADRVAGKTIIRKEAFQIR